MRRQAQWRRPGRRSHRAAEHQPPDVSAARRRAPCARQSRASAAPRSAPARRRCRRPPARARALRTARAASRSSTSATSPRRSRSSIVFTSLNGRSRSTEVDLATDDRHECGGWNAAAQEDVAAGPRRLEQRECRRPAGAAFRRRRTSRRLPTPITSAPSRKPPCPSPSRFPIGSSFGQNAPRRGLVDHDDLRLALAIAVGEPAAAHETDAERREVVRRGPRHAH